MAAPSSWRGKPSSNIVFKAHRLPYEASPEFPPQFVQD
jgi:hypothetical protein